jgi:hypothetical protein
MEITDGVLIAYFIQGTSVFKKKVSPKRQVRCAVGS